jgi:hypothetical protein
LNLPTNRRAPGLGKLERLGGPVDFTIGIYHELKNKDINHYSYVFEEQNVLVDVQEYLDQQNICFYYPTVYSWRELYYQYYYNLSM